MTTSRLKMAYAAGLAAVVALAGCGDGGTQAGGPSTAVEGRTSTAVTSPATPTTPTRTTAPVDPVLARIPAAARPETRQGAEAFVRFFFEQVNAAFTKPDAAVLPDLFDADCLVCASLQSAAQDLDSKEERHSDRSLEVTGASVRDFTPALRTVVVFVRQNSVPVTNAGGTAVRRTNKEEGAFLATLAHQKGRWVITKLQVAK